MIFFDVIWLALNFMLTGLSCTKKIRRIFVVIGKKNNKGFFLDVLRLSPPPRFLWPRVGGYLTTPQAAVVQLSIFIDSEFFFRDTVALNSHSCITYFYSNKNPFILSVVVRGKVCRCERTKGPGRQLGRGRR